MSSSTLTDSDYKMSVPKSGWTFWVMQLSTSSLLRPMTFFSVFFGCFFSLMFSWGFSCGCRSYLNCTSSWAPSISSMSFWLLVPSTTNSVLYLQFTLAGRGVDGIILYFFIARLHQPRRAILNVFLTHSLVLFINPNRLVRSKLDC